MGHDTGNKPWKFGEDLTRDELILLRYVTRCWILQDRAGLSFDDARAFLAGEPPFSLEEVASDLGTDVGDLLKRRDEVSVRISAEHDLTELFCGFTPITDVDVQAPWRNKRKKKSQD